MRLIGHLPDEQQARRFVDYLFLRNMHSQTEPEAGGQWAVWVHDDDHLDEAAVELEAFRKQPDDLRYRSASATAATRREADAATAKKQLARQFDRRRIARSTLFDRIGLLTLLLMVVSVWITLYTGFGENEKAFNQVAITEMEFREKEVRWARARFAEIRQGQYWRLFTPMFVHMDPLHLLFNMMWLAQLATAVEKRYGWSRLLVLVLAVAAFSNAVEYLFVSPAFGGMSGVVFGLFGFIWTQSKYCPASGFIVPPLISGLMIGWFIYCIVGLSGQVANFVHWGGLASGSAIGYVASLLQRNDPLPGQDRRG